MTCISIMKPRLMFSGSLPSKLSLSIPQMYGFDLGSTEVYTPLKFKTVKVKENIPDLIQFALDNGTNFKMLKAYNPWLLKDGLVVEKGKEYKLKIPEMEGDSLEQFESEIPADHSEGFQAEGAETGENRSGKEESN